MKSTLIGLLVALFCVLLGGLTHRVSPVFLISQRHRAADRDRRRVGRHHGQLRACRRRKVCSRPSSGRSFPQAPADPAKTLTLIVQFARKARHEGLLSLESEITDLDLPFMRKGLQLAIDGSDPDAVAAVLRNDIRTMKARHKVAADWCQLVRHLRPDVRHHRRRHRPDRHARPPRQARGARRRHRLGVRRHVLGGVHRQRRDAAALRQDEADVDAMRRRRRR